MQWCQVRWHTRFPSTDSGFSGDWVVIYTEQAIDRATALKRERQLKSFRGREFVKTHIPRWRSGSAARC